MDDEKRFAGKRANPSDHSIFASTVGIIPKEKGRRTVKRMRATYESVVVRRIVEKIVMQNK